MGTFVITHASRTLPGTNVEFTMRWDPNPPTLSCCAVCNTVAEGSRFRSFVNDVPAEDICVRCALDLHALVCGGTGEPDIALAASLHSGRILEANKAATAAARGL